MAKKLNRLKSVKLLQRRGRRKIKGTAVEIISNTFNQLHETDELSQHNDC
jgi:hypothetical protein